MKILLSNKFYYPKGGDCVYTLELEKLLMKNGHEVGFFAMDNPLNQESIYSEFFPSNVDYSNKNIDNLSELVIRPLLSKEVRKKFNALLDKFKPDLLHVNNIHSQLSPIIVREAYKRKIPVVWTLHDYKLICSRYDCLLEGEPCELCFKKPINVLKNKCIKNSYAASAIAYLEAKIWDQKKLEKYTSLFICPSSFLKGKMIEGGFSSSKLHVMANFIDEQKISISPPVKEDYCCFVGRLSEEKGIETLCDSISQTPSRKLLIIGSGPEEVKLKAKYKFPNIEFLGQKKWDEIQPIISKAQFLVIPSKWYENNPLSVIESFACGTPVIGSKIGGIPELLEDGSNGFLFKAGDADDLTEKIKLFYEKGISMNSKALIESAKMKFASTKYYNQLITIYQGLIQN